MSGGSGGPAEHDGPVSAVDFSPDSGRLATATGVAKISYVWEMPRGRELVRVRHFFGAEGVKRVAFSPDGRKVISVHGWTVSVWDAASGRIAVKIKQGGFWPLLDDMAVSADGELLATFESSNRDVCLWRIADAQEVARLPHDVVKALCFDPLGRYLATAGVGVRIWDLQGRPLASLPHEITIVNDLAVSADGARLATASDKTARVWELG